MRRILMLLGSFFLISTGAALWAAGATVIPHPKAVMMLVLGLGALRFVRRSRPT